MYFGNLKLPGKIVSMELISFFAQISHKITRLPLRIPLFDNGKGFSYTLHRFILYNKLTDYGVINVGFNSD